MHESVLTAEQLDEGGTEDVVEDCIDDRVQRRRHVAEPDEGGKDDVIVWGETPPTDGRKDVDGEERRPAHHEDHKDDAQHLGGLLFCPDRVVSSDTVSVTLTLTHDVFT